MTEPPKDTLNNRALDLVKEWAMTILGAAGCISVGAGVFDRLAELPLFTMILAMAITLAAIWKIQENLTGTKEAISFAEQLEGPILWTAMAWILYRITGSLIPQSIILPVGIICWLIATSPTNVFFIAGLAGLAMEFGLTISGNQNIPDMASNLLAYALPASLVYYAMGRKLSINIKLPRPRNTPKAKAIAKTRKKFSSEEIQELGMFTGETSLLGSLPPLSSLEGDSPYSHITLDNISASFGLQLEILRRALGLTTVAVLWQDASRKNLRLRNLASSRDDINQGPYPCGSGISGALAADKDEFAMAPAPENYAGIPYYKKAGGVGSLILVRIPDNDRDEDSSESGAKNATGILCVDRLDNSPWTEQEREILRLTARKLSLDVSAGRRLLNMDRERSSIQRLCLGLRELNDSLGLESVFDSTINAVKALVPTDFIAISLLDDDKYRVVRIDGPQRKSLSGREFVKSSGLVGQVLKTNTVLPAGCRYRGAAPIFDKENKITDCNSLIILPLRKDDGTAFGTLTVASSKDNIFTTARQDILDLIAEQVAIKIDLGQAHEKINQMAITDGLTGLANHRTFQHAFDIMLSRAQRAGTPICLIMCDLDHFKNVNDTYGHPFGDKVLMTVADILKSAVRSVDLVARYGGEEFTLILEDTNQKGGPILAERIRKEIEALALEYGSETVKISISLGMAIYPKDGEEKGEIIERADQALYNAKRTGRNKSVLWSANMKEFDSED